MSEEQIKQILRRLDRQDDALTAISEQLKDLEPVKDAFNSVMGFDKVGMWILKALAALGVGIGIIYTFINWLKQ